MWPSGTPALASWLFWNPSNARYLSGLLRQSTTLTKICCGSTSSYGNAERTTAGSVLPSKY